MSIYAQELTQDEQVALYRRWDGRRLASAKQMLSMEKRLRVNASAATALADALRDTVIGA